MLREKALKTESDVKFYGESVSTEDIYEQSEIEQAVWQSLDGENCKIIYLFPCFSKYIHIWAHGIWKDIHSLRE